VKNPASVQQGLIRFHDIGDYLTREQKLAVTARFGSVKGIGQSKGWTSVTPDVHGAHRAGGRAPGGGCGAARANRPA